MRKVIAIVLVLGALFLGAMRFFELSERYGTNEEKRVPQQLAPLKAVTMPLPLPRPIALAPEEESWVALADKELEARSALWQIRPYHELKPEVSTDPLGTVVRYSVFQEGIAIPEMQIQFRFSRNRELEEATSSYLPTAQLNLKDIATDTETIEKYRSQNQGRFQISESAHATSKIIISTDSGDPALVYAVAAVDQGQNRRPVTLFLRAGEGDVLRLIYPRQEFSKRYIGK